MKDYIVTLIFAFVRWYFVGKTVHRMTMLDGQKLYGEAGRVVSGVLRRNERRFPVDMEMFMIQPGRSPSEMVRFSALALKHEKGLGWVFYD